MKNRKGFTLVELLIAITILGIIMAVAIPALTSISRKDIETQEKIYETSLVTAAKMYNDSYSEDTFGRKRYGCAKITYSQLKDKELIKELESKQLDCAFKEHGEDSSGLIVRKVDNHYYYESVLWCKNKTKDNKIEKVSGNINKKLYEIGDDYCNETASDDTEPPVLYYTNNNLRYFYNSSNLPKPYVWIIDAVSGLRTPASINIDWTDASNNTLINSSSNTYTPKNSSNLGPQPITLLNQVTSNTTNGQYKLTIKSKNIQDMAGKKLEGNLVAKAQEPEKKVDGGKTKSIINQYPEVFYVENTKPTITTTNSYTWINTVKTISLSASDEVSNKVYSGIRTFTYKVKNDSTGSTINNNDNCGTLSEESGITKNNYQNSNQKNKSCSFKIGEGSYGNGSYTVTTKSVDWAGNESVSSNTYQYDGTNPTVTISRTAYNKYKWSASDTGYSGLNGYYNNNSANPPTSGWQAATASGTVTITSATTYYTHVIDKAKNTAKASITAYTVTRSQGTGTSLTTKFENGSGTSFTNNPVVLNGTPIYIASSLKAGYGDLVIKFGSTTISTGTVKNVSSNVTISSSATQCAKGTWNDGSYAKCQACPTGYTSDAGATAQTQCYIDVPVGKYKNNKTGYTTTACANGYYNPAHKSYYNSADSCTQCPSGYRDGGPAGSEGGCKKNVSCGYYVGTAKGNASQCGGGTYKEAHSVNYGSTSSCNSCGSGKTSDAGSCSSSNCRNTTTRIQLCRPGYTCIHSPLYDCHYVETFGTQFDAVSDGNYWRIVGGSYDGCWVSKNCIGAVPCDAAQCPG